MYPRLYVARDLLREDGVIFISIDDHEVDNLKKSATRVLGEENHLGCIVWQKKYAPANDKKDFSASHDYILSYTKSLSYSKDGKRQSVLSREERTQILLRQSARLR